MRWISFALTTDQFIAGTKTVTRRVGWESLRPNRVLKVARKVMGFRAGQTIGPPIGHINILNVRREPLDRMIRDPDYGRAECVAEGFPDWSPEQFVEFFCRHNTGCFPERDITRIEFEKVDFNG